MRSVDRAQSGGAVTADVDLALGLTTQENLRADAELARSSRPRGRVAVLTDRAVSVGVGVPASAGYLARAERLGLSVARRQSGGTAVVHAPGDLAWSLALPRGDPWVGRDFVRAYGRLGAGATRFLRERGFAAGWVASPGLSPDYCLLAASGEVLSVNGLVVGGAAQRATAGTLVHHGVLPLTVDRPLIGGLFGLPTPGPADRLGSLRELGLADAPEALARSLAAALAAELDR